MPILKRHGPRIKPRAISSRASGADEQVAARDALRFRG